jgi:hypothetical protein
MKPRPSSARRRPPTRQLLLPLPASRVGALDARYRAGVIATLARLLLEAARPAELREGGDDAS